MNGVEQERLKQAVDRLIDAQLEALDLIAERSEPNVEDLEEDTKRWSAYTWKRPWRTSGPSWKGPRKT